MIKYETAENLGTQIKLLDKTTSIIIITDIIE